MLTIMATKIKNTVAQKSVKQQNVRDNISADLQKKIFFFCSMECSIISFFNLVYQELILHYEYCWPNYAVASQFYGSFHLDFSRNEKNYDSANGCSL